MTCVTVYLVEVKLFSSYVQPSANLYVYIGLQCQDNTRSIVFDESMVIFIQQNSIILYCRSPIQRILLVTHQSEKIFIINVFGGDI